MRLDPHRLMLHPRGQQDQQLTSSALTCSPPAQVEWTQDTFGNLIATASFAEPSDILVIDSRIVIDQSADAWPIYKIAPSAHRFPFAYSTDELLDLGALTVPGTAGPASKVRTWLAPFLREQQVDTLSLLKNINQAIARDFSYRSREEEGTQSPDATLSAQSGSCRDFAMLFVEAARQLGFGARAVSGYVYDEIEAADQQHGSTHAWAEIYLPCAGWIAFDPTNARVGGSGLISIAIARDIRQIRPVAGSYQGDLTDFIGMDIAVTIEDVSQSR